MIKIFRLITDATFLRDVVTGDFFGVLCKTQDGYLQNSYYEMELDVRVLPKYKLSNRSLINYPDRFGKFSQDYLVMDRYI